MIKMSSKLTFGPAIADWQERINTARLREYRTGRVKKIMRQRGLPAILEASPSNIRYLTGLRGFDYPMARYILFFAEHDPVMFEHDGWYHQMPDQAPWIRNWRIARSWLLGICGPEATKEEAGLFASEIQQELKDRGLAGEQMGLGGFDSTAREALLRLDLHPVDTRSLLQEARTIKNIDEINCLKMVAAITDGVWQRLQQTIRPGLRDTDLMVIASTAAYELGAETAVPGSWRTGPITFDRGFGGTGRILQAGDLAYASLCGNTYMGYRSCSYRTFIVGRQPSDKEKDWYKRLLDRLNAIISEISPGKTTADAARHFPPASSWGYKEEAEVLCSEIGHGIGLGGEYDMPVINRQWSLNHPQVFEEGMAIAVEGREGETRVGGVRLENMLIVTKDGAEIIDHMPRNEILVAGV